MKRLTLIIVVIGFWFSLFSQLPAGSTAPNWTLTDINGNQWELYDLTSSGKAVYIHLFATWDGVGWNYHNSGALQTFYNEHGPSGSISDGAMVFLIEGDASTTLADIQGLGPNTNGDWTNNSPFPIIDLGSQTNQFNSLYNIQSIPTIYKICSDNKIYEVGTMSSADLSISLSDCINYSYDAFISDGPDPLICMGTSYAPTIVLRNNGAQTLTSCDILYEYDANGLVQTYSWSGNLPSLQSSIINLPLETFSPGSHVLRVITSSPNGVADEDPSNDLKDFPFVVGGNGSAILSVTSCDSYTGPSGAMYTSSGVYTDVVVFPNGCGDSTYTIDLTINNSIQSGFSESICDGSVYTWNNIDYSATGIYTQSFQAVNGCDSIVTLNLTLVGNSSLPQSVCVVGIDSLTNRNRIVWERPLSQMIDSFYVYKETSVSNNYVKIGSTSYSDLCVFIDQNSNPSVQAERYKISILDTCGFESILSDFHKTIHLTINSGVGGAWNLIWSHYEGLSYNSYNIYRGSTPSDMTLLTTIQSNLNSYTDLTPPNGYVYYQVEIVNPNNCDPAKSINYSTSRSNIASNDLSSIVKLSENSINIFPVPTIDNITVKSEFEIVGMNYILVDNMGKIIREGVFNTNQEIINLEEVVNGIYFLEVENSIRTIIVKI